jgi:hypothetical protein
MEYILRRYLNKNLKIKSRKKYKDFKKSKKNIRKIYTLFIYKWNYVLEEVYLDI